MSSKQIKGLTVEIGGDTAKLDQALKSVEAKGTSLSGELKNINALLKLDPTNTELLAQKQKVLADAISNTEEKLKILKEAEKQAQAQFEKGEISAEQYRALQRDVIATETKLKQYKKAAEETSQAAEGLGDSADRAAHKLKEQKEKTSDAERATEDLGDSLGDAAKTGFSALVAAATAAIAAIAALAESTREYRTEMGKLDTAFQDAGFSGAAARKTYQELQGILGETDQAVEAANHLAALCSTEEELNQWTAILTGTYAKWGASLQPENLAETANETARTGAVTGALADALNWAAAEGETFGVTMKAATKKNEEWNKAVAAATKAEDFFNLALQECSSEQERQQLITKTLTDLYGGAAAQYKKTNAELIRANKANEEWNATLAEAGEVVEPVVTDVKELGTALLKQANAPLKEVANYIRNTFLPNLVKVGSWAKQNLPQISVLIASVTATLVLHKVAAVSAEMATKGLTLATLAQEAAQKALNVVMNANPYVLVATSLAATTAAFIALNLAMTPVTECVNVLTAEEKELMKAADETAQSFREQQTATQDALGGIAAEMGQVQNLATELQGLADASGAVQEKDQARAQFILNELNSALGTEYTMVDGVIQKYAELKNNIEEVMQSKLADSLLETANADYVAAIQAESDALANLVLKEKDYQSQLTHTNQLQTQYDAYYAEVMEMKKTANADQMLQYEVQLGKMEENLNKEKGLLAEKEIAYNDAAATYGNYSNTIATYEEAQTAALEGNYQLVADLLVKKGQSYGQYSDKVSAETAQVLDTLFKEAVDAGLAAERTRQNFENGVAGYTAEMVEEAERSYTDALAAYANAYADAEGVGEDLGSGLAGGMENTRSSLVSKARSLVSGIISAMRKEADSHSPARKTIDFGEDVGEGTEIGIENKTDDVARAAKNQAAAMLDAYNSQEIRGQNTLRGIADRQAAAQVGSYMSAGTQNTGVLNKILSAIEKGQVLTINGDLLVGATEGTMDGALGVRQILAERGAL